MASTTSPAPALTAPPVRARPEAPTGRTSPDLLPATTAMDAVTLHVADLAAMTGYYRNALGLDELDADTDSRPPGVGVSVLGRGNVPLVVLVHTPDLPAPSTGQAGLFHTALLFDDRPSLARAVAAAAAHPLSRYVGSADHLVSQAFYFTDPEGNGIELYWDRPRAQWEWDGSTIRMASLPLDPRAFLQQHLAGVAQERAEVGHVHLKVGDIPTARDFYVGALGFTITADLGSALFVSAGGYHHHMAMNTWESAGAGPRAATIGLGQVSITVPGRTDLDELAARLRDRSLPFQDDGRTVSLRDPWESLLEVTAADARA